TPAGPAQARGRGCHGCGKKSKFFNPCGARTCDHGMGNIRLFARRFASFMLITVDRRKFMLYYERRRHAAGRGGGRSARDIPSPRPCPRWGGERGKGRGEKGSGERPQLPKEVFLSLS